MKRIHSQPLRKLSICLLALILSTVILINGWSKEAYGFSYEFHHEISGWTTLEPDRDEKISVGLRYLPSLTFEYAAPNSVSIDAEISINAYETARYNPPKPGEYHGKLKPYRSWLRCSTAQFEIRAGLQKINFGSATLLRPLMWFDQIDPRDPLQLTDGVYGVLGRYYFLNNANIWLWGLYGNDDPKGWETVSTNDNQLEVGGRVQIPLYTGEIALAYHHRKAMVDMAPAGSLTTQIESTPEDRIGIDGKWDLGVGIWFEGVWVHQNTKQDTGASDQSYRRLLSAGIDYTFDWGNGLHAIIEHLVAATTEKPFDAGDCTNISALSVGYPLGLIDHLSTIINYDWKAHRWFRYAAWQRTYDDWNLFLMGFWNPSEFSPLGEDEELPEITGKGLRVMVVYNR